MSTHPTATPERVIALVAATLGDTEEYGRVEIDLAGNRDAYARVVDTLDALAWLTRDCVHLYKRNAGSTPWERVTVGGIEISGPLGFTPASDRFKVEPIQRLSERTLQAAADDAFGSLRVVPTHDGGDAA